MTKDDKVCPCVNCIVKTMCNDACEEYNIYENHITKVIPHS